MEESWWMTAGFTEKKIVNTFHGSYTRMSGGMFNFPFEPNDNIEFLFVKFCIIFHILSYLFLILLTTEGFQKCTTSMLTYLSFTFLIAYFAINDMLSEMKVYKKNA